MRTHGVWILLMQLINNSLSKFAYTSMRRINLLGIQREKNEAFTLNGNRNRQIRNVACEESIADKRERLFVLRKCTNCKMLALETDQTRMSWVQAPEV